MVCSFGILGIFEIFEVTLPLKMEKYLKYLGLTKTPAMCSEPIIYTYLFGTTHWQALYAACASSFEMFAY